MEKVKKIINSISWVIVALTGILLIVKWNDIPALVITHIGMGISYGSKNILPMLFCIELVVTFLFTLFHAMYDELPTPKPKKKK